MRLHRFLALAVLCAAPTTVVLAAKRSKIECSRVSLTPLTAGWGKLPAALQKLPPKANLCGVNGAGVAFITSELTASELQKFYAPLFASVGCKPLTCKTGEFIKTEKCGCPKGNNKDAGAVEPQSYDQAYKLWFSEH
jgi:hypothetical protein